MRAALVAVIALAAAACVDEHDVDVYLVLPDVDSACQMLGAATANLAVETVDGEAFEVRAEPCLPTLADQPANGFRGVLERLGPGYHRVTATILDADGALLGVRSLPFPVELPVVVGFARADLPGWPRVEIDVAVPECVAGGELAEVRLTAAPPDAARPELDEIVPCSGATGATRRVAVSRGPVVVAAEGRRLDGTTCWTGDAESLAFDGVTIEVPLTRSCP